MKALNQVCSKFSTEMTFMKRVVFCKFDGAWYHLTWSQVLLQSWYVALFSSTYCRNFSLSTPAALKTVVRPIASFFGVFL